MADHNTFNSSLQQNHMINPMQTELVSCVKDVEQFAQTEFKKVMREVELKLFANLYAICVPTKERLKTQKAVRALRKKRWEEALKSAKGNEEKALDLLFKSYRSSE